MDAEDYKKTRREGSEQRRGLEKKDLEALKIRLNKPGYGPFKTAREAPAE